MASSQALVADAGARPAAAEPPVEGVTSVGDSVSRHPDSSASDGERGVCGWRVSLARALESSPSDTPQGGRWGSVATVRAAAGDARLAGRPAVRTVNIRGLGAKAVRDPNTPDSELLCFTSDSRSAKTEDVREDPRAEMLVFLRPAMVQVRFSGELQICGGPPEENRPLGDAEKWWQRLEPFDRRYFVWPRPGQQREHPIGSQMDRDAFPEQGPGERPECFVVCSLVPDHVEVLDLRTVPAVRTMYWKDPSESKGWKAVEVNP